MTASTKKYGPGPEYKKIYLISPRQPNSFWSMQGTVDALGAKTLMPNPALATLMALTPEDVSVEYVLCDENVRDIDYGFDCHLAAVTGSSLHADTIHRTCREFRKRGVPVALGGTYASIEPDRCEDLADYHFIGEAEFTWPQFLREWTQDRAQAVYEQQDYIDMKESPLPDWSLVDVDDYVSMPTQTSRGCPNRCEFCDVIQYLGKKHRVKSVDQVMAEVKNAHALGARSVFFTDDNFYGNKAYTRKLVTELVRWNSQQELPLTFSTQITIQIADDEELVKLLADAKFSVLFIGVESVRKESLKEVKKQQNLQKDIYQRLRTISKYGLVPFLGLIVGFDNDDASIFDELFAFLHRADIPITGIGLLNAPRATPLYQRLKNEGRIIDSGGDWQLATNIVPKNFTGEELLIGCWELFYKVYDPQNFEKRLTSWLTRIDYFSDIYTNRKFDRKQARSGYRMFKYFLFKCDWPVRSLFFRMMKKTWQLDPRLMKRLFTTMAQYAHFYEFVKRESILVVQSENRDTVS
jgi:radical SAM superfamily enzyme YgiQ (UPF0313 family)